ncbi:penicillin-binding protein [Plakobranchus ocellatus]|uniref:Penicillin-binding protein n=1 Tax=Plakobranchus ocellatus TaxID=259542 RepID=A0AAV4AQY0_9GAST|nr:penicillin-binding protein [Plakobranchus ocellatus]
MTGSSLVLLVLIGFHSAWAIANSNIYPFDDGNLSNDQSHSNNRRESHDERATKIDQAISEMFECFNVSTAMSISVVKDGKVILSKGYGRTRVKGGEPVTSKTRFAVGSLTKAVTSILIMKWILQNENVELDTPIQKFYPEFRLADDLRTSHTSFRDLLAHRTGIGGDFFPLFWGFPKEVPRTELVKRMADIPASHQFRNKLHYNNYMYMVAANVLERLSGNQTWEEMVRDQLLVPLNMSSTGFFTEDNYDIPNFARSCAIVNDSFQDIPPELLLAVVQCGPAGSIYTNAEDMALWLKFLLSLGRGQDDEYIINPSAITGTWDPSMDFYNQLKCLPKDPVSHSTASYGLGWILGNYRGYQQIYHTGGITAYSARLWLFPDINAGIFLIVNGPQMRQASSKLGDSVMYYVADELIEKPRWFNISEICREASLLKLKEQVKPNGTSPAKSSNQTVLPTTYSPEIGSFVGIYSHDCFGTISIFKDSQDSDDQLRFEFGRFGKMQLTRVLNLTFQCEYYGHLAMFKSEKSLIPDSVTFLSDGMGGIEALQVSLGGVEPVRFKSVKESELTRRSRQGNRSDDSNTKGGARYHQASSNIILMAATFTIILSLSCFW